jgi:N-acetylmuramoyl-L-alanine amidase
MVAIYRAASIAAVTFCTAFGVASAPSFAETVTTAVSSAVSSITNEQVLPPVPQVEPSQAIQNVESAPAAAAVPEAAELPKATSLAQLVAQQEMPASLDRETECLAASIYFEAKGEPLEGQLAVAEVVKNRAGSGGRFPSSICQVVFQKGQFHFVRGGGFPPIAKASDRSDRAQ